jgi:hypothetical protein
VVSVWICVLDQKKALLSSLPPRHSIIPVMHRGGISFDEVNCACIIYVHNIAIYVCR